MIVKRFNVALMLETRLVGQLQFDRNLAQVVCLQLPRLRQRVEFQEGVLVNVDIHVNRVD